MMKKPNNWDNVQAFSDRQKLPLGAYVCKIQKAVVQPSAYGEQLCIIFDICEGEHAGFYRADFNANTAADKKWKGVLRQWLPTEDGSDRDELTKRVLKGLITAIEKSNPGFVFNWDETTLAGKVCGILYRNEEWEYNGKSGWAVRPFRAISVDSVRDQSYTLPKDKPLKRSGAAADSFREIEDDGDLPF